ncbi:Flagellin N-methylase [compost metagenome]
MTHSFPDFESQDGPLLLPLAMQEVRHALPMASNLGRSADTSNVYALIDRLTEAVQEDLPRSLCAAGCGHCCELHRALIRVYRSEWDVVHDHLVATRSEDALDALVRDFWERFPPYLPLLERYQAMLDADERPKPTAADLPIACPLLDAAGACSVYPVRPAICRGYGLFSLEREGYPEIFACGAQREAMEAQLSEGDGPKLKLPSFSPLYQKVADLCEDEPKQLIPLWFAQTFPRR